MPLAKRSYNRGAMSLPARHNRHSLEEYVNFEAHSGAKHEYWCGEIYAMAGGTPDDARLSSTLGALIRSQLAGDCETYSSDLRVRVLAADLDTYPDVSVICGKVVRAQDDRHAATNPVVLVEVTSPSTEIFDRGDKLAAYKQVPTLREVLIASHQEPRLTLHRRGADGSWTECDARGGESLGLVSVGVTLAVDEVYAAGLEDAG
jgi:Uma2 family endonuclease